MRGYDDGGGRRRRRRRGGGRDGGGSDQRDIEHEYNDNDSDDDDDEVDTNGTSPHLSSTDGGSRSTVASAGFATIPRHAAAGVTPFPDDDDVDAAEPRHDPVHRCRLRDVVDVDVDERGVEDDLDGCRHRSTRADESSFY